VSLPPSTVAGVLRSVLEVLFPRRCVACGSAGWPFCECCLPSVGTVSEPWCERCGRPLEAGALACGDCPPRSLSWARSAFLYEGAVRRAVMQLKFGGARMIAEAMSGPMAVLLEPNLRAPPRPERSDPVITWVPLSRRRRRARGYDQAEVLARDVARRLGVPVRALLRRTRETAPQARRGSAARRTAMLGAFAAVAAPPARVVLIDDVLTTGATAAGCAHALLGSGAREVGVLTAARSLGGPVPARCYTPPSGPDLGLWLPGRPSSGSRCQSQAKRPT
jgi:ComF family protein